MGLTRYLRAPKKDKKGGEKTQVVSNDLINIFVDKKDPELQPLEAYPPWLKEMLINHDTSRADRYAVEAAHGDRFPLDPIRLRHHYKFQRRMKIFLQKTMPQKEIFNSRYDVSPYDWDLAEADDLEDEVDNHLDPLFKLSVGSNWEIEKERERLRLLGLLQYDEPEEEEEGLDGAPGASKAPEKKEEDRRAQIEKQRKADKEADEEVARMMRKNK